MWAFIREIQTSPIYLREQGRWGEPNPYYATILRYLPLLILLVLGLGVVCGSNQFSSFFGLGDFGAILVLLVCLPNIVIQVLTWTGILLAPALTAPSIVEELKRGSWEILRLTPKPTMHIIVAKFFGSMSRLKIWWSLLIVSIIYALVIGVGSAVLVSPLNPLQQTSDVFSGSDGWQIAGLATLNTVSALIRPWLEIGFSGLVGLTLSLWTNSARAALVGSYATVILYRIIGGIVGISITSSFFIAGFETASIGVGSLAINFIYLASCVGLFFALRRRARYLDSGELMYE